MKKLSQGAEAIVYQQDDIVVKDRVSKEYRHPAIDSRLRRSRTKREAKILEKLAAIDFPTPRLRTKDDHALKMTLIQGPVLKDVFEQECAKLSQEIGQKIAVLHDHGIIHGDLTTSNMVLADEVFFIDFGLSFFSDKIEDKAVDLHLFRQALESKHYTVWKKAFRDVLKGYTKAKQSKEILSRLQTVEQRGRNKGKM